MFILFIFTKIKPYFYAFITTYFAENAENKHMSIYSGQSGP